jgi:hypothetical protein
MMIRHNRHEYLGLQKTYEINIDNHITFTQVEQKYITQDIKY